MLYHPSVYASFRVNELYQRNKPSLRKTFVVGANAEFSSMGFTNSRNPTRRLGAQGILSEILVSPNGEARRI